MSAVSWLHELVLGALLGNVVILISTIKFILKLYRNYDDFWHRHRLMWQYYCKQTGRKPGRLFDERTNEITTED